MVWQDYKIEGDSITLTKQKIQEAKNHYCKVADKFKPKKNDTTLDPRYMLYIGKADVLIDILKMFEPLEG